MCIFIFVSFYFPTPVYHSVWCLFRVFASALSSSPVTPLLSVVIVSMHYLLTSLLISVCRSINISYLCIPPSIYASICPFIFLSLSPIVSPPLSYTHTHAMFNSQLLEHERTNILKAPTLLLAQAHRRLFSCKEFSGALTQDAIVPLLCLAAALGFADL